ncbi:unnamed protein product [Clonostachys rhizophaga]|uniref:Xaa-Pro dipeptidyl-peptidase C-terminal domain-containing protein n=1 Tax=Clonostachys rhizophaga TaxID=160324 RepID=A0A9N9YE19_9HYPO|nr:unnamed protein product [Clonostachys rhizophaga]
MKEAGMMALQADMTLETDVKIRMRDGVHLYADIYRPVDENIEYPAILSWSPYGKHLNMNTMLASMPGRVGLHKSETSGFEDFEGLDPAFYVPKGYAVFNVDIRGSWRSEGDLYFWGRQEQIDGYDTIEHLASLPWCNGKVGMAGNSWLAISQWFIAAGKPPHLAAIAPWEGLTDAYRDQHRRGGMANRTMPSSLGLLVPGNGLMEEAGRMAACNPTWSEYWEDKKVDLAKITVPAYVVASYTSKIHVSGSFRGFRNISSREKWLRVHPYQEWYDFIGEQADLLRFFDYFLKGKENGWQSTPTVRSMDSYPPPKTLRRKYYLNASSGTAEEVNHPQPASCSYRAAVKGEANFENVFRHPTTLAGYPTVRLCMHCEEHDDMDVFVLIRKLDRYGNVVEQVKFPTATRLEDMPKINTARHQGPSGMLRNSHRAMEPSTECAPGEIFHPHITEDKVSPGSIVALEFNTWPIGMFYEAGEGLRLSIGGRDLSYAELDILPGERNCNRGAHVIHTGGEHESWNDLPFVEWD